MNALLYKTYCWGWIWASAVGRQGESSVSDLFLRELPTSMGGHMDERFQKVCVSGKEWGWEYMYRLNSIEGRLEGSAART